MKIGINCLMINPSYRGGINTYTFGLLDGFAETGEDLIFQIYVHEKNCHLFERYRNHPRFQIIAIPFNNLATLCKKVAKQLPILVGSKNLHAKIADLLFHNISRTMDDRSDIIYTPTTVLFPYRSHKPTLLSMHDIQHVHYPQFFSYYDLMYRRISFALSAERATFFQASSEFIKGDLLKTFPSLDPGQIEVIPEGVNLKEFGITRNQDVIHKYGLPRHFLFCPAQLWQHKNHLTVLRALNILKRDYGITIPLVLTGEKFSAAKEIFTFIKDNDLDSVHYLGKVPFEDIVELYQRARLFITAVLYESSSLPVLEAAASRCAIIASDTPPNREMSSILKLELFSPLDAYALAALLERFWNNDNLRQEQIMHNMRSIHYYSWENVAKKYLHFMKTRMLT